MKPKRSLPIVFLMGFILSALTAYADVYSRINSTSRINGTSDCYLVNYTLWESQGTTNPNDDVSKGTYNAVIGTDCPTQQELLEVPDLMPYYGEIDQENGGFDIISIYPNPSQDEINIKFKINLEGFKNETKWTWSLISFDNVKQLSGVQTGYTDFAIPVTSLNSGRYLLVLVNENNEFHYQDVTIVR